MPPRFGGAPKCPRCEKSVYMAEQVLGPGGFWHTNCLTCEECNKRLDSMNLTEKDNKPYCKVCYNRQWGPKGYGFAGGPAFLSTETKMPKEILATNFTPTSSPHDAFNKRATPPPDHESPSLPSRTAPSLPTRPGQPALPSRPQQQKTVPSIPSKSMQDFDNEEHLNQQTSLKVANAGSSYLSHQTSYVPRKFNFQSQQDTCVGCRKTVYAVELVLGAGNKYHKACRKCTECGKTLDSINMVDNDSDLYCKGCYSKKLAPKGYGFGNMPTVEDATR